MVNHALFINEKQVEEIYGFKVMTLRNMRFRKVGPPYHKIGRTVKYKVADVENFMENHKIETEAI